MVGEGAWHAKKGLLQRLVHEDALLEVLCRILCLVAAPAVPRIRYSPRLAARHPTWQPRDRGCCCCNAVSMIPRSQHMCQAKRCCW